MLRKSLQYLFLFLFAFSFLVPPLFAPTANFDSRIVWIAVPLSIVIFFCSEIGWKNLTPSSAHLKEYNYFPMAKSANRYQTSFELNATFFFMSGFAALMFFMTLLCYDEISRPLLHSLVIFVANLGKQIFAVVDRMPAAINNGEGNIAVEKVQSIFTVSLLYFSIATVYYLIKIIFSRIRRKELVTISRHLSERGWLLGMVAFSALGVFGVYQVLGGNVLAHSANWKSRWVRWLCLDANCFAANDLATIWAATWYGLMIFTYPLFAITGLLAALEKIRRH